MSGCLRGREIVVAIRRGRKGEPKHAHIVVPAHWTKADAMRYVRREHPDDSVRLVEWMMCGSRDDPWQQRLWIANPNGFADYARARRATA